MSVHPARRRRGIVRARVLDRVFLGCCIATYLVLMVAVIAALRAYSG